MLTATRQSPSPLAGTQLMNRFISERAEAKWISSTRTWMRMELMTFFRWRDITRISSLLHMRQARDSKRTAHEPTKPSPCTMTWQWRTCITITQHGCSSGSWLCAQSELSCVWMNVWSKSPNWGTIQHSGTINSFQSSVSFWCCLCISIWKLQPTTLFLTIQIKPHDTKPYGSFYNFEYNSH